MIDWGRGEGGMIGDGDGDGELVEEEEEEEEKEEEYSGRVSKYSKWSWKSNYSTVRQQHSSQ